ncbi:hypothetical protein CY34DRAFT_802527 [Suillus luteus UH-Slu-Lm8-n1]|uniref:Uncharacterized protein n=1 Tax=Suillus luteus UH-Slu-Lm8-n1 TaxID=930992 RepID=A0A0D0AS95_9AGAM|nr:hypothetical protein CY34DRAFT_802527 [Suillus luteus UH-Slu-Lm8-n1]
MSYFDDMRYDALLRTAYPPSTNQKAPEPVRNINFTDLHQIQRLDFMVGQKQHVLPTRGCSHCRR